jgi:hypothetical protein
MMRSAGEAERWTQSTRDFRADEQAESERRQANDLLNAIYEFTDGSLPILQILRIVAHVLWLVHTHLMDAWE